MKNNLFLWVCALKGAWGGVAAVGLLSLGLAPAALGRQAFPTGPALSTAAADTVSKRAGDDINTSTLYGPPTDRIGQSCVWVDTGLADSGFTMANGWKFTYADAETDNKIIGDLTVSKYKPWVTEQPIFTDPAGTQWGGNHTGEWGGAELDLKFDPKATDPLKGKTIHWIQGYREVVKGAPASIKLDLKPGSTEPFYDSFSSAGDTYFSDIPGDAESEYENNPVSDVQFQVYLAVDNGAGGGVAHNVTLYAGKWWGYRYTAVDVPEPSAGVAVSGLALAGVAWRRRWKTTG